MIDDSLIRHQYLLLRPRLDERGRRLFAATQVRALGRGGIVAVVRATGIAATTIGRGLRELDRGGAAVGRVRRPGGGRKKLCVNNATLVPDLRDIVEPITYGDPERALRWVSKSRDKLAAALREQGHTVSPQTVGRLLHALEYRRRGNAKAEEGKQNPDRDAQFLHINKRVRALQTAGQPVILNPAVGFCALRLDCVSFNPWL
jgi:hypothetical protein